jgi:hypothetical protein
VFYVESMNARAGYLWPHFTERHPVVVFLLLLGCGAALFELLAANFAGGWSRWGENILWYRASCLVNDILLASGAYIYARMLGGPRWWASRRLTAWAGFVAVCALGAMFLMWLARNLAALHPEAPPMATDWFGVAYRTILPVGALLWVRWRLRT